MNSTRTKNNRDLSLLSRASGGRFQALEERERIWLCWQWCWRSPPTSATMEVEDTSTIENELVQRFLEAGFDWEQYECLARWNTRVSFAKQRTPIDPAMECRHRMVQQTMRRMARSKRRAKCRAKCRAKRNKSPADRHNRRKKKRTKEVRNVEDTPTVKKRRDATNQSDFSQQRIKQTRKNKRKCAKKQTRLDAFFR